jgi:hypothetical protein
MRIYPRIRTGEDDSRSAALGERPRQRPSPSPPARNTGGTHHGTEEGGVDGACVGGDLCDHLCWWTAVVDEREERAAVEAADDEERRRSSGCPPQRMTTGKLRPAVSGRGSTASLDPCLYLAIGPCADGTSSTRTVGSGTQAASLDVLIRTFTRSFAGQSPAICLRLPGCPPSSGPICTPARASPPGALSTTTCVTVTTHPKTSRPGAMAPPGRASSMRDSAP